MILLVAFAIALFNCPLVAFLIALWWLFED